MERPRRVGRPSLASKRAQASPTRNRSPKPVKKSSPVRSSVKSSSPVRSSIKSSSSARGPSPKRRSSRARSSAFSSASTAPVASVTPPSPIKEEETKPTPKKRENLGDAKLSPTTKPPKVSSSVYSAYSSSTQKTVEIRSSGLTNDTDLKKLSDYIRRSVSKPLTFDRDRSHTPTTNTEVESRYSRSASRSVYDDDDYSKAEFSDNENDDNYKSLNATRPSATRATPSVCRQLEPPREFGGWIGTSLLLLLIPFTVYYLQWSCPKGACVFRQLNLTALLDVNNVFHSLYQPPALSAYFGFVCSIIVLSALLPGRIVSLPVERRYLEYKFTALPLAVVASIALGVAQYLKYPVVDFILQNYLLFCVYGFLTAFGIAVWNYFAVEHLAQKEPSQSNIYGRTGNFIIDFAQGRELNRKLLLLVQQKQVFYQVALISTLIFAECFLYKKVQIPWLPASKEGALEIVKFYAANIKYDAGALLATSLLLLYILDAIIFEHHLASSFELQGEGLGCFLLFRYAATPYLLSAVAKYFYDNRIPISCKYAIYVAFIVLLAGLCIKRLSSAYKYKYRMNSANPIFDGIETIHTFQGRRLLLGPFWGRVRQPNYAGDILALIGLSVPLFLRFAWPPLVSVLLLIAVLIHRAVRVQARNKSRYHSSWVRYCGQVRHYIVPHVF